LGSNQDNFQLQRFTTSENIAKSFRGLLFLFTLYVVPTLFSSVHAPLLGRY